MQGFVSILIGLAGLYLLGVGTYQLVFGEWFPYLPDVFGVLYSDLQGTVGGGAFKFMAILLLIGGGLAFFFAFLLYPRK